jgi:ABC-type multidrug transport system ATPase subunit
MSRSVIRQISALFDRNADNSSCLSSFSYSTGLRSAMKLAGLQQSQHFLSWGFMMCVSFLVSTLLVMAFGYLFQFEFFTKTDFIVNFLTLLIFGISLVGWIFLFSVLARRTQSVTSIAFNFFIFSYILASAGDQVYVEDSDGKPIVSESVLFLRDLFAINPVVMFNRAVQGTSILASTGFGLTYSSTGTHTDIYPVRTCWNTMLLYGIAVTIVAIYLDNILASNSSAPLSPLYFLSPHYWGFVRRRASKRDDAAAGDCDEDEPIVDSIDTIRHAAPEASLASYHHEAAEDADVARERELVESGQRDHRPLVFKSVRKRFARFTAVDNLSLSVPKNHVMCLLGHNGSGKSTIQGMLSTALTLTSGDIFVNGMSIKNEQVAIRKTIGICPQFDRYWDLLSGREHIDVFAALRGLRAADRQTEINARMEEVSLTEASTRYAESYSGGMLRRLSVAIALTGNPSIVALDEPSTGTDPISKREIWTIIEKAKADRVVLLITHSMAEAQALGDSVAILASSKLRVFGTSLHLKGKFGCGYRITAVTRNAQDVERIGAVLAQHCVGNISSKIAGGIGGEGVIAEFGLPQNVSDRQLEALLSAIEQNQADLGISNFSVDQTTLDDVFKSITALSEDVDPLEQRIAKRKKLGCCCC